MKILTWNIYKDNRNIGDAIEFLKVQNADIVCLQEYPLEKVELLNGLNMQFVTENEFLEFKNPKKKPVMLKMVIASKFPIKSHCIIQHKNIYEYVTRADDRYKNFQANSFYIDIDTGLDKYRVFNTHFKCVAGPYHRLSQFREILENLSQDRHNIVCGDFNTFGKPLVNIFLWKYFGYKLREISIHEGNIFNALFDLYQLKNVFKRMITFWKFPAQFDYILIPTYTDVVSKKRLGLNGSDHFPLLLEI